MCWGAGFYLVDGCCWHPGKEKGLAHAFISAYGDYEADYGGLASLEHANQNISRLKQTNGPGIGVVEVMYSQPDENTEATQVAGRRMKDSA